MRYKIKGYIKAIIQRNDKEKRMVSRPLVPATQESEVGGSQRKKKRKYARQKKGKEKSLP
jgi:hypothetical protein